MANPTLFDVQKGDIVLNAALLAKVRAGTLVLHLLGEQAEVKFDALLQMRSLPARRALKFSIVCMVTAASTNKF
jgi:hypothetical protein